MSRRRAKLPVLLSMPAAWLERTDLHACPALRRAILDAVYDVVVTTASKPKRDVLLLVPNTEDEPKVWTDRVRWCPYCGHRIRVIALRQPGKTTVVDRGHGPLKPGPVVIPDALPPEVG